jgi:hypothetical protein
MKIKMLLGFACALGASVFTVASAETFRCGNFLIREGMAATEIAEKCGEPTQREVLEEPIMATRPNGTTFQVGVTSTEIWIYDRGPGSFPARLTIDEGIARTIELLTGH